MHHNFFEKSCLSSFERFHSQMFCWLMNNSFISKDVRIKVINSLFNTNITMQCNDIHCITEYKRVDLLLTVDNFSFIIENKLRSSQHPNQLSVYKSKLDEELALLNKKYSKNDKYYYYFLTLIGEKAEAPGWNNITYEKFQSTLKKYEQEIISHFDETTKIIYFEYVNSITHLVEAINDFKKSFVSYPSVFEKKENFNYKNHKEDFIVSQKMETIFQKQFYHIIASKMSNNKYTIDETHGKALLEFDILPTIPKYNKFDYKIGIQFQGNCVKLFFRPVSLKDYDNSSIKDISLDTIKAFEKLANDINNDMNNNKNKNKLLSFSRINVNASENETQKRRKRKAFISISFKKNKSIPSLKTYKNAVKCFQEEYNIVEEYAKKLNDAILKSSK